MQRVGARTAKYESRIIALVLEFREIASSSIRGWSFLISCPGCAWTPQCRGRGQGTRSGAMKGKAGDRKETYDDVAGEKQGRGQEGEFLKFQI